MDWTTPIASPPGARMFVLKRFAESRPYLFAFLLAGVIIVVHLVVDAFRSLSGLSTASWTYLTSDVVLALLAVLLLAKWQWWQAIGYRKPYSVRRLWAFLLPLFVVANNLMSGNIRSHGLSEMVTFFLVAAFAGFVEETFFRGLMLRPLLRKGPWRAALITAILFGLLHSLNIVAGGNPGAVLAQMVFALAIGFSYAAILVYTGTIWPLVLIHFLTDFSGFLVLGQLLPGGAGSEDLVVELVYVLIFLLYGALLLTKSRHSAN